MKEKMHNKIKDININLINNYNSDITKNPIPVPNINTNINTNSFSQENIFNELINTINCQESKNNSSFSESINSNQENPNIIMNKDQLYHIFILFQRLINQNQNQNMKNNVDKNEESTNNTNNTLINNNISRNKNIIKDFKENKSNNINKQLEKINLNLSQCLKKNKSDTNVILEQKEILKDKEENKNALNIVKTKEKNNKKNPYDDIPIKINTINFLELVEKKLADEENNKNKLNNRNKNYIRKIMNKVKKDKIKNKNSINKNLIIKEEKTNTYRESINKNGEKNILNRNNNKLTKYSFDKEETKIKTQSRIVQV